MSNFVAFNYIGLDGEKRIDFANQETFDIHAEYLTEDDESITFVNCTVMRNGRFFKLSQKGYKYITACVIFTASRDEFTLEELLAMDLNKGKKVILSDLVIPGEDNMEVEITPEMIIF